MNALYVTFILSWAMATAYYVAGGTVDSFGYILFASIYMWIPGLVALYYSKKQGEPIQIKTRPNVAMLQAAVWPVAITLLSVVISLPFGTLVGFAPYREMLLPMFEGWTEPAFSLTVGAMIVGVAWIAGCTLNALAALGEELMWRGYLFEYWKQLTPRDRDLRTGFVWGLWHAPMILMGHNFPGWPIAGVFVMILLCIVASPVLGYLRERGVTVLTPAIFHGTLNAIGGLTTVIFHEPNMLVVNAVGLAGIAAFVLWILAVPSLRKRLTAA